MLNLHGEKLSEELFYSALQKAANLWGAKIFDYTTCECIFSEKDEDSNPHYVVFLESEKTIENPQVLDETLQDMSFVYKSFRIKGSISELKIVQVKPGTFDKLKEFILNTTEASSNQIKIPRVLKKKEAVKLLNDNQI